MNSDTTASILAFFIVILIPIALLVGGCIWFSDAKCHWKWDGSGREVQWHIGNGCQVKDGKGWVPAENFRAL